MAGPMKGFLYAKLKFKFTFNRYRVQSFLPPKPYRFKVICLFFLHCKVLWKKGVKPDYGSWRSKFKCIRVKIALMEIFSCSRSMWDFFSGVISLEDFIPVKIRLQATGIFSEIAFPPPLPPCLKNQMVGQASAPRHSRPICPTSARLPAHQCQTQT